MEVVVLPGFERLDICVGNHNNKGSKAFRIDHSSNEGIAIVLYSFCLMNKMLVPSDSTLHGCSIHHQYRRLHCIGYRGRCAPPPPLARVLEKQQMVFPLGL